MSEAAAPTTTARTYTVRGNTVVSRTAVDSGVKLLFEVTVLRPGRKHATFQGTVVYRDGSWHAEPANNGTVQTGFVNYIDAERTLVKLRTGVVSTQPWRGPRPRFCDECAATYVAESGDRCTRRPTCRTCGWHLNDDRTCTRPDLHWTAASLAAEDAARDARRAARAALTGGGVR